MASASRTWFATSGAVYGVGPTFRTRSGERRRRLEWLEIGISTCTWLEGDRSYGSRPLYLIFADMIQVPLALVFTRPAFTRNSKGSWCVYGDNGMYLRPLWRDFIKKLQI